MLRKVDKRSFNFEPCHRGAFGEIRTHTALLLRQSPLPVGLQEVVSCQELASCCRVSQTRVLLYELATGGGPKWVRTTAAGFSVRSTTTIYTIDPFACIHVNFYETRGNRIVSPPPEEHLHAMQGLKRNSLSFPSGRWQPMHLFAPPHLRSSHA